MISKVGAGNQNQGVSNVAFGTNFTQNFKKFITEEYGLFSPEDFNNIKALRLDGKDNRTLDIVQRHPIKGVRQESTGLELAQNFNRAIGELNLKVGDLVTRLTSVEENGSVVLYSEKQTFIDQMREFLSVARIDREEAKMKASPRTLSPEEAEEQEFLRQVDLARTQKETVLKNVFG